MDTYAQKRIRYWLNYTLGLGRYWLFLSIVWRDWHGFRITWSAAWDVARVVYE